MSGLPWFRMYAEMIDDPKIGTLSDADFRVWVELLCLACKGVNGDTKQTIDELSWSLRRDVTSSVTCLEKCGLVNVTSQKTVKIKNWMKRQSVSDHSAERVRKHRNKKGKPDGGGNGGKPLHVTDGNGFSNALDKNRIDRDKKREEQNRYAREPDPDGRSNSDGKNDSEASDSGLPVNFFVSQFEPTPEQIAILLAQRKLAEEVITRETALWKQHCRYSVIEQNRVFKSWLNWLVGYDERRAKATPPEIGNSPAMKALN